MAEGEHTVISKIPRERINQIAARKLASLSVPVRLGADRETLEGELAFSGKLVHPATGHHDPARIGELRDRRLDGRAAVSVSDDDEPHVR